MSKNKLTPQEKENLIIHCKDVLKEKKHKISLKEKLNINILILENKLSKLLF